MPGVKFGGNEMAASKFVNVSDEDGSQFLKENEN